jgi:hypothetical protein
MERLVQKDWSCWSVGSAQQFGVIDDVLDFNSFSL